MKKPFALVTLSCAVAVSIGAWAQGTEGLDAALQKVGRDTQELSRQYEELLRDPRSSAEVRSHLYMDLQKALVAKARIEVVLRNRAYEEISVGRRSTPEALDRAFASVENAAQAYRKAEQKLEEAEQQRLLAQRRTREQAAEEGERRLRAERDPLQLSYMRMAREQYEYWNTAYELATSRTGFTNGTYASASAAKANAEAIKAKRDYWMNQWRASQNRLGM